MKRIIALFICLVLAITFSACTKDVASSETLQTQNETTSVDSSNEQSSEEAASVEGTSSEETKSEASSSKPTASSKPTSSNKGNSSISNPTKDDTTSSEATSSTIPDNVIGDIVGEDGNEPVYGVDYGGFVYSGAFINYASDGDVFYSIHCDPHTLYAYDTESLSLLCEKELPVKPGEVQVDERYIYVSLPSMKKIVIYNKNNFAQVKEILLENEVGSFCFDGDQLYYAEYTQQCAVYSMNLITNETIAIDFSNHHDTFHQAHMLLNKEKGLLYISENHISNSTIYAFNISDMTYVADYVLGGRGYYSNKNMYLVNEDIYWAGVKLDAQNLRIKCWYGEITNYKVRTMPFADENFVVLNDEIYLASTGEWVADMGTTSFIAITKSMNMVVFYQTTSGYVAVVVPW